MERVGVVRVFIKDFTVEIGGSLEAPGLVVLNRSFQFRRQSRWAPGYPITDTRHALPIRSLQCRTVRGLPL